MDTLTKGKIELKATMDGLLQIDIDRLTQINSLENMMIATRHTNTYVKKGDKLAGTRIIPLVIEKEKMKQVARIADQKNPLMTILPFVRKSVGIVTTGNEVYYGRIKDTFTPVIREKMQQFGVEVIGHKIVGDDPEQITKSILELKQQGAQMILCTGGMSVDPDDRTPLAIRNSGADIISYGAPVLPGAMFLLGYFEDGTPVMTFNAKINSNEPNDMTYVSAIMNQGLYRENREKMETERNTFEDAMYEEQDRMIAAKEAE